MQDYIRIYLQTVVGGYYLFFYMGNPCITTNYIRIFVVTYELFP